jgi:hypothetical protein
VSSSGFFGVEFVIFDMTNCHLRVIFGVFACFVATILALRTRKRVPGVAVRAA